LKASLSIIKNIDFRVFRDKYHDYLLSIFNYFEGYNPLELNISFKRLRIYVQYYIGLDGSFSFLVEQMTIKNLIVTKIATFSTMHNYYNDTSQFFIFSCWQMKGDFITPNMHYLVTLHEDIKDQGFLYRCFKIIIY